MLNIVTLPDGKKYIQWDTCLIMISILVVIIILLIWILQPEGFNINSLIAPGFDSRFASISSQAELAPEGRWKNSNN